MKVRELMTPSPVAIEPETPLKDVAAILVEHGTSGRLERRSDTELLPRVVARVPGVVSVHSTLRWRWDDRKAVPKSSPRVPNPALRA
jgi:CBS domain-containing protein